MRQTLEFIAGVFILISMIVVFWRILSTPPVPTVPPPDEPAMPATGMEAEFRLAVIAVVQAEIGQPIEGYEPAMLLQVFPGLAPADFDGVDASIGQYVYTADELRYEPEEGVPMHSAGPSLTTLGFGQLLGNVVERLAVYPDDRTVETVMLQLRQEYENALPGEPPYAEQPVACTMEAKQCPDGSFVGRVGPDCAFAACPDSVFPIRYGEDASKLEEYRADCEQQNGVFDECASACEPGVMMCVTVCSMVCTDPAAEDIEPITSESVLCTPESRNTDACVSVVEPVCATFADQYPAEQTFGNSCLACQQADVVSYTAGECIELN